MTAMSVAFGQAFSAAQAAADATSGGFNPVSMFATSEPGWVYDNNDLSGFYSDSAMTTQAVVNGPVGAQRDKSPNAKHRTQTTAGSRRTLRGTPIGANLVTNGTFVNADGWTLATGWAIGSGTLNATALAPLQAAAFAGATITAGRVYRIVYTLSNHTAGGVGIRLGAGGGASYTDGTPRTTAGTFTEYITAGFSGAVEFVRRLADFTGSIDNVEVHDVSADSVTAPYGVQNDPTDDFMQTASVDFTGTDAMTFCVGVRKLSDAALGIFLELGTNATSVNGSVALATPAAASASVALLSRGTATATATYTNAEVASPATSVLTGVSDISTDTCVLRVNGVQRATSATDQGTGNYGNLPFYFGRRGGVSNTAPVLDFGGVFIGRALTATELANTERWTGQRTGVVIP